MFIILCAASFLIGAGLAIIGISLWGLFDIDVGETMAKVGLGMMIIPVAIFLLCGAAVLLLSLFGLVVLF